MRILVLCALFAVSGAATAAPDLCTRARLDGFIAQAQTADVAGIATGKGLVACKDLSAEAVQWLAFLLSYTGNSAQSLTTDEPASVLSSKVGTAKPAVLARARGGDYRELWAKVDAAERSYSADPESLLVIGRALARKTLFNRARDMYVTYLRLRPGDAAAEAEYLYTFLWEKGHAEAKPRFEAAARRPLPQALALPVKRGLTLVGGRSSPVAEVAPTSLSRQDAIYGNLSATSLRRYYRRDSFETAYVGLFDLKMSAHRLQLDGLEEEKVAGTEASLGVTAVMQSVTLSGHGGYFSPGVGAYFGDAGIQLRAGRWTFAAQGVRQPLLLARPLPADAADLMQDLVSYKVVYSPYLEVTSALGKDGDYAAYERHLMTGRWPLRHEPDVDWLAVRMPLTLEVRPRPNPNFDTAARLATAAVGLEGSRRVGMRILLGGETDYGLARWTDRLGDETQIAFFKAEVRSGFDLSNKVRLTLSGRYAWADEEALLLEQALTSAVVLGIRQTVP